MENIQSAQLASKDFGFRLLAWLAGSEPQKNIFISPASISLALAMTYNGARGNTQRAMAETLGLAGLDMEAVNQANAVFLAALADLDPQVQLSIANSIWVRAGISLDPGFIQRNTESYRARVTSLDFNQPEAPKTINGWVADHTGDKIKEIVKPPEVAEAILILINALYFKGLWARPFDPKRTRTRDFVLLDGRRKRQAQMSQYGRFDYLETIAFQAVRLPYGAGRVSMYIFLPREGVPLAEFGARLGTENWGSWISAFDKREGYLGLPRFKLEYEIVLNAALKALGMGVAFGSQADFSGMTTGPLLISKVIHKTFAEVDEKGTEAAAATAVIVARSAPLDAFTMKVERPFFCAIRDDQSGAILFMGYIVDPK